jgi:hypothetical protein
VTPRPEREPVQLLLDLGNPAQLSLLDLLEELEDRAEHQRALALAEAEAYAELEERERAEHQRALLLAEEEAYAEAQERESAEHQRALAAEEEAYAEATEREQRLAAAAEERELAERAERERAEALAEVAALEEALRRARERAAGALPAPARLELDDAATPLAVVAAPEAEAVAAPTPHLEPEPAPELAPTDEPLVPASTATATLVPPAADPAVVDHLELDDQHERAPEGPSADALEEDDVEATQEPAEAAPAAEATEETTEEAALAAAEEAVKAPEDDAVGPEPEREEPEDVFEAAAAALVATSGPVRSEADVTTPAAADVLAEEAPLETSDAVPAQQESAADLTEGPEPAEDPDLEDPTEAGPTDAVEVSSVSDPGTVFEPDGSAPRPAATPADDEAEAGEDEHEPLDIDDEPAAGAGSDVGDEEEDGATDEVVDEAQTGAGETPDDERATKDAEHASEEGTSWGTLVLPAPDAKPEDASTSVPAPELEPAPEALVEDEPADEAVTVEAAPVEPDMGVHGLSELGRTYLAGCADFPALVDPDAPVVRRVRLARRGLRPDVFVRDLEPSVRAAVASSPLAGSLVQYLAADHSYEVREAVASSTLTDPATLMLLAGDTLEEVALSAVANPSVPKSVLASALESADHDTASTAAANPSLSADDLRGIIRSHRYPSHLLTANPNLPSEELARLVSNPERSERVRAIASSTHVFPPQWRSAALADGDAMRRALAAGGLDEDLARALMSDPAIVRATMAENTSAPMSILLELSADPVPLVRTAAASNPSMPEAALLALVGDDGRSRTKRRFGRSRDPYDADAEPLAPAVAANPSATPAVLSALLDVGHPALLEAVLEHPNADLGVVLRALRAQGAKVDPAGPRLVPLVRALDALPQEEALLLLAALGEWDGSLDALEAALPER